MALPGAVTYTNINEGTTDNHWCNVSKVLYTHSHKGEGAKYENVKLFCKYYGVASARSHTGSDKVAFSFFSFKFILYYIYILVDRSHEETYVIFANTMCAMEG